MSVRLSHEPSLLLHISLSCNQSVHHPDSPHSLSITPPVRLTVRPSHRQSVSHPTSPLHEPSVHPPVTRSMTRPSATPPVSLAQRPSDRLYTILPRLSGCLKSHRLHDTPISPSACPSPADCLTATTTRPPVRPSFPMIHHTHDSTQSLAVVNGEQSHTLHHTQDSSHSLAVGNGEQSRKSKKFHRAFTNYDLLLHALDASSIYLRDFRRVAPPKSGEDAHVTHGKCDFAGASLNNPSLGCSYVIPRLWDPGGVSSSAKEPMKASSCTTMINSASLTLWLIQMRNFLTTQESPFLSLQLNLFQTSDVLRSQIMQAQLDSTRPISYRSYFDLLKDAAFHLDQATKRGNKIRRTNVHFSGPNDEDEHPNLSSYDPQVIQQENVCSEPPELLSYSVFQSHFQGSSTSNTQKIFLPKPIWEKLSKDQQQMIIDHNRSLPKSGSSHLSTSNKSPPRYLTNLHHNRQSNLNRCTPTNLMKALLTQPKLRPPLLTLYWQWSINPLTPLLMMLQTSPKFFQLRGLVRFKTVNATFIACQSH